MSASKWDWTTESPSVPGIYWAAHGKKVEIVELLFWPYPDRLSAYETANDDNKPLGDYTHWIGPLIPPPPPIGTASPELVKAGASKGDRYGQL